VRRLLLGQEHASVLDLLQQCQQGAIQIGTIIEEAEGEDFPTVNRLEEYCELVFQVFEMVQSYMENADKEAKAGPDADVICNTMDRLLAEIEENIHREIQVRKEVVFLPYKASMWDSLESVWRAAMEDPDCDAYVVPIPYFDKNPDGTVKTVHYEGDMFPKDVPITHYSQYDITKKLPSMAFIHNPYDEANYVTSVHPDYYSKRLKEYTDCLVYIPYFVLGEVELENPQSVKEIEHFIMVPGVVHADKVIVQSEKMRKAYIQVMTEWSGENTRGYWEAKILGLGSPKFDKVGGYRKEDLEIPQEWNKILYKEDGTAKKVILYNTSINGLLEHGEQMLRKMQDVFRVFKERTEEIALLWRPHPLIQATIESMRPQLWEQYQKLVENYRLEGWGIYDDTPDMNRVITLCDGYYGDRSSLVQLCQEAEKPILLQDVEMLEKEGEDGLTGNVE